MLLASRPSSGRVLSLASLLVLCACIPSDPVVRHGRTAAPPPDALAEPDVELPETPGGLLEIMSIAIADVGDWVMYAKQDRDTIRLGCLTKRQRDMESLFAVAKKDASVTEAPGVSAEVVSYRIHSLTKQCRELLAFKARARSCVNAKLLMTDPSLGTEKEKTEEIQRRSIPPPTDAPPK